MKEAQSQRQGPVRAAGLTEQESRQRTATMNRTKSRYEQKLRMLAAPPKEDPNWENFSNIGWNDFHALDTSDKLPLFSRKDLMFDCLFSQQFDRALLDRIVELADILREATKTEKGKDDVKSLLRHKRAMHYFQQVSTRTFLSFQNACHILGMKTSEIRDTSTSSEMKGETPEDSVRTFSSYVHLIIMRHIVADFAEKTAWLLNSQSNRPVPVINGGSGKDQHPTQALLDVYTIGRYLEGGVDGKHIVMVGDLKRGRTVRSLSYLMKNYDGVRLTYVSPPEFKMEKDILEFLSRHGIPYTETDDFDSAIKDADAVYMTRIQDEHDKGGESAKVDYSRFNFTPAHLGIISPHCIIMHPLPRRKEIHIDVDKDKRAVYWRQERNGMWIRAALIAHIMGVGNNILELEVPRTHFCPGKHD